MGFIADSVLGQLVATTGTIVVALLTLVANATWRRARKRAGKPTSHSSTRLLLITASVGTLMVVGGLIWTPNLPDRLGYALVVGLASATMAGIFSGVKFSEWTRETRLDRLATDRERRATQHLRNRSLPTLIPLCGPAKRSSTRSLPR